MTQDMTTKAPNGNHGAMLDLKDETFDAAIMIDGMLTNAIAMQTEIWKHCQHRGIAKTCDAFNEALTCSLTIIQREVDRLKRLSE